LAKWSRDSTKGKRRKALVGGEKSADESARKLCGLGDVNECSGKNGLLFQDGNGGKKGRRGPA